MTCIIGIECDNGMWMCGDSAAVSGWDITQTALKKVFEVGPFLIGYTSSFRMGQILQYHLKVVERDETFTDDLHYLVVAVAEQARTLFIAHGWNGKCEERDEGGNFLVGYRGKLYEVQNDYQVSRNACGYASTGSGYKYALGSLMTSEKWIHVHDEMERLQAAGAAAERFSAGVLYPFEYMFQEYPVEDDDE